VDLVQCHGAKEPQLKLHNVKRRRELRCDRVHRHDNLDVCKDYGILVKHSVVQLGVRASERVRGALTDRVDRADQQTDAEQAAR
jgi:hypothetical protein